MSSTIDDRPAVRAQPTDAAVPPASPAGSWGNSAPLALAAFAVTTFMLSMVNGDLVNAAVLPVVFGVALMFGGITQLIAGVIQLRVGNTFGGVLFSSFGAFWMSLFAIVTYFLKSVPPAQVGHALGLYLFAFGILTVWMWLASFRTNLVVVIALFLLIATFFILGAGNYDATTGLVHAGGYLGLVVAALAGYLSCAEVCEASYGRWVLPVWSLAKKAAR